MHTCTVFVFHGLCFTGIIALCLSPPGLWHMFNSSDGHTQPDTLMSNCQSTEGKREGVPQTSCLPHLSLLSYLKTIWGAVCYFSHLSIYFLNSHIPEQTQTCNNNRNTMHIIALGLYQGYGHNIKNKNNRENATLLCSVWSHNYLYTSALLQKHG